MPLLVAKKKNCEQKCSFVTLGWIRDLHRRTFQANGTLMIIMTTNYYIIKTTELNGGKPTNNI